MLRIELEDPDESTCECCGNTSVRLTRFVYQNDDAFAVYYAAFTREHEEKVVKGLIGLGEWGDDDIGEEARIAFPFEIWESEDNYNVRLIDADESLWSDVTFLGRILNRDESLSHEWINDVFHITDHMVKEDEPIVRYFNEKAA